MSQVDDADNATDDDKEGKNSSKWCCRFLDVGGYGWVEAADLRKIRSDFLELPFQVGNALFFISIMMSLWTELQIALSMKDFPL